MRQEATPALGRVPRRWRWVSLAGLVTLVGLTQGCGGDKRAGPSGMSEATVTYQTAQRAQLPATCTGVLTATGPGMAPIEAPIRPDGRVFLVVPAGPARTFTVVLTCQKTTSLEVFTGSETLDVPAGQALSLSIRITVNEPARDVRVSCSAPSDVGARSTCQCMALDPDPADVLRFSWSVPGGAASPTTGPSTSLSSPSARTFTVTCTVSDGRSTRSATTRARVNHFFSGDYEGTFVNGDGDLEDLAVSFQADGRSFTFSSFVPSAEESDEGTGSIASVSGTGFSFNTLSTVDGTRCAGSGQVSNGGAVLAVGFACSDGDSGTPILDRV